MGLFLKGDISKREPLKFAEEIGYV